MYQHKGWKIYIALEDIFIKYLVCYYQVLLSSGSSTPLYICKDRFKQHLPGKLSLSPHNSLPSTLHLTYHVVLQTLTKSLCTNAYMYYYTNTLSSWPLPMHNFSLCCEFSSIRFGTEQVLRICLMVKRKEVEGKERNSNKMYLKF